MSETVQENSGAGTAMTLSEIPARAPETPSFSDIAKLATAAAVRLEMGAVRQALSDLHHDIQANTEVLKLANVPLEQVADSHERASVSFENLSRQIGDVSQRLSGVEQVIDTAGLRTAQQGAEARFNHLANLLEATCRELVLLQGRTIEEAKRRLERRSVPKVKRKPRKSVRRHR